MLPGPIQVALRITRIFDQQKIPYFLGGSFASILHGIVRTTQDVDIVADIKLEHVPKLVEHLQDGFYVDEVMIQKSVSQKSSFNILHKQSLFKVDIFIPRNRPFEQSQFRRAQLQALADIEHAKAQVASAEDILLAKLEWYHEGGEVSERQWRDVLGILKVQANALDMEYLHYWAHELGVNDLLEKLLQEG